MTSLFAKGYMKVDSSHNKGQTYVHFRYSCNSPIFARMWPRLVSVTFFFFIIYSSVFAQEKFTVVKNLRSDWMTFERGSYKPLGEVPFTGLNTIYFELSPESFPGRYLRLKSGKPYFFFVNGKVRGEYRGEKLLSIDSLQRVYSGPCWVALHQDRINVRDLLSEIISLKRQLPVESAMAARPYSYFRDFVVISGLIIIFLFLVVLRLHPKQAADYLSIFRMFSSREAEEGQNSARLTNSANVQFYILGSLMIGFYLIIILQNLPPQYALPIRFQSTGFWMIWWQWLKLSAIIFSIFLIKIVLIFSLTRLFGFRGMARFHFFNWMRLLLVIFGTATILLFMYFISRGDHPVFFVLFLSVVVVTLGAWIAVAFFKLGGRSGHSLFHLFSYLCATEIIPLLITVKVLFQ